MSMTQFKKWLTDNAIIMDFIQKVVVSLASIAIATVSVFVASSYYHHALGLAEANIAPDLYLQADVRQRVQENSNEQTPKAVPDLWLGIYNTGGPIHKLIANTNSFIVVKRSLKNSPTDIETVMPILGYYLVSIPGFSHSGLVYSFLGPGSNDKTGELTRDSLSYRDKENQMIRLYFHTIVHASYFNRLNTPGQVWFLDGDEVDEQHIATYNKAKALADQLVCNVESWRLTLPQIDSIEEHLRTRERC
jgi:hypothetical protein